MAILERIRARLDDMTPGERDIGGWILDNPDRMLRLSSSALAAEIGCSQSSVVKFGQKLGFRSYQDLKLAISEARARRWQLPGTVIHGLIEKGDPAATILQKLIGSKFLSMQKTAAANDEEVLLAALDRLDGARRILLAGVGASSLVARDFSYKLLKLGRMVVYSDDSHVQMANVSAMGPQDLLIALSHSGKSSATLGIAELARRRGGGIIAVTGMADNPLARIADLVLHEAAEEERDRSSSITARDAQLTLTDFLFLLLVQRQPDASDFIAQSETAVAGLKTGSAG